MSVKQRIQLICGERTLVLASLWTFRLLVRLLEHILGARPIQSQQTALGASTSTLAPP